MRHSQVFTNSMEIEAKFIIPDATTARQLRRVQSVATFTTRAPTHFTVRDTFFDTAANELRQTKHVLRIRQKSDGHTIFTFKAPSEKIVGASNDNAALHSRPETEVQLAKIPTPRVLHLNNIPPRLRKLVAPLVTQDTLYPLFSINQSRSIQMLHDKRRTIAEWSVDFVKFHASSRQTSFYELEVELKKSGTVADLEKITAWLTTTYNLAPQPTSKFARALAFFQD